MHIVGNILNEPEVICLTKLQTVKRIQLNDCKYCYSTQIILLNLFFFLHTHKMLQVNRTITGIATPGLSEPRCNSSKF